MYWPDGSFVTGRTTALGRKDGAGAAMEVETSSSRTEEKKKKTEVEGEEGAIAVWW